jgi:hypothetical protein
VAAERRAGVAEEARVLHRRRADDDGADAVVEVALDGVEVADAAAELHRNTAVDLREDGLDGRLVDRLAGKGAVEVDQVQAAGARRPTSGAPWRPGLRRKWWRRPCRPAAGERSGRP